MARGLLDRPSNSLGDELADYADVYSIDWVTNWPRMMVNLFERESLSPSTARVIWMASPLATPQNLP
jgi:hypothetical protein